MAIQVRRGLKKDFIPEKLLPGEWAVSIDSETENQIVWMCFAPGVVKRMGTYEDFARQTQEVLDEVSTSVDTVTIIKSDIADNLFPQIQQYAQDTEDRSIMAESYTHGGTSKREGEDTDNAKYYMNRARLITGGDYATHEEIEVLNRNLSDFKNNVSDAWTQRTWTAGEICISDNNLWKCLISNSDRPSEGLNWEKTTIAKEMQDILSKSNNNGLVKKTMVMKTTDENGVITLSDTLSDYTPLFAISKNSNAARIEICADSSKNIKAICYSSFNSDNRVSRTSVSLEIYYLNITSRLF